MHYLHFSVISKFPHKTVRPLIFKIFLQFSLPPPYTVMHFFLAHFSPTGSWKVTRLNYKPGYIFERFSSGYSKFSPVNLLSKVAAFGK